MLSFMLMSHNILKNSRLILVFCLFGFFFFNFVVPGSREQAWRNQFIHQLIIKFREFPNSGWQRQSALMKERPDDNNTVASPLLRVALPITDDAAPINQRREATPAWPAKSNSRPSRVQRKREWNSPSLAQYVLINFPREACHLGKHIIHSSRHHTKASAHIGWEKGKGQTTEFRVCNLKCAIQHFN